MTVAIAERRYKSYVPHMKEVADRVFQMRVTEGFLRQIDEWRRQQPDLPPRAEAIRRLIELGLQDWAASLPPLHPNHRPKP